MVGTQGTTAETVRLGCATPMPTRTAAKRKNASSRFMKGPPSMMITRLCTGSL